jgi:hypothetical protein
LRLDKTITAQHISDGEEENQELQEEKIKVMTNLVVSDFFPVVAKHDFSQ